MTGFWRLLEESVMVSGFIATGCVGVMMYLAATGQPIPDLLANVVMVVVGFFFGGKVQKANTRIADMMSRRGE